jgi:hypothetical protein
VGVRAFFFAETSVLPTIIPYEFYACRLRFFVLVRSQGGTEETATPFIHWESTVCLSILSYRQRTSQSMPTYTIIGFEKDGFDSFSSVATANDPANAARKAIEDTFIKTEGRRPPDSEALAQLEDATGLFVVGIIEGEHDNLNEIVDHYEQW